MRIVAFVFAGVVAGALLYVGATILADSIGTEKTATLLIAMTFGGLMAGLASGWPR